ncbi:hypothetical protein GIB67_010826 [Kingdonia uniflora]|uniref:Uncharacterized protein n=1 Tax=Kingdonia uniflora TaxID=39325 RepID=A0A7J7L978_9MAGN|nr:hypothetical protein GIB67_010826 [Kingdonia uniflora]
MYIYVYVQTLITFRFPTSLDLFSNDPVRVGGCIAIQMRINLVSILYVVVYGLCFCTLFLVFWSLVFDNSTASVDSTNTCDEEKKKEYIKLQWKAFKVIFPNNETICKNRKKGACVEPRMERKLTVTSAK